MADPDSAGQENSFTTALIDAFNTVTGGPNVGLYGTVVPNPLDQYESYTYGLTMSMLGREEYANFIAAGIGFSLPNVMIAAGGSSVKRHPLWKENFFFENFKMTTVVGLHDTSHGVNAIDITFDIIEPYGLSFLDRLVQTASMMGIPDYISAVYLLQIDFFDSVKGLLIEHRKMIPFKFIDMRIKVTQKGSTYSCAGFPYQQTAYTAMDGSTQARVEVNASTLSEFFKASGSVPAPIVQAANDAFRADSNKFNGVNNPSLPANAPAVRVENNKSGTGASSENYYKVSSYVDAVNGYNKTLADLKAVKGYTEIQVIFDQEILAKEQLKLIQEPVGQTPMADSKKVKPGDKAKKAKSTDQGARYSRQIDVGTKVTDVINQAMKASEYMRSQITLPTTGDSKNQTAAETQRLLGAGPGTPTKLWKITTQTELKEWDSSNNFWFYKITYFVQPYKAYSTVHPFLPKSGPSLNDCVKRYDYIYTGKNTSILDLNIEFNYAYFTKFTAWQDSVVGSNNKNLPVKEGASGGAAQEDFTATKNSVLNAVTRGAVTPGDNPIGTAGKTTYFNNNGVTTATTRPVVGEASSAGTGADVGDRVSQAVESAWQGLYSSSIGDMLNIKLKIIGDPTWIKQDDMVLSVSQASANGGNAIDTAKAVISNGLNKAGSLVFDSGEILVWINFKIPADIDENTGGMTTSWQLNGESRFTGVYKCMTIDNVFENGQFTQSLDLIRILNQSADSPTLLNNDAGVTPIAPTTNGAAAVASVETGPDAA